ncbi:MAG: hypothetical protein E4G89_07535 [Methanothrix sp.]|nr:MAG: hypothetical protein E4G89_07535 [Methanothrix sp.]
MAKTVNTGWRTVNPGECFQCGMDSDWEVDGRGNILCSCQACTECGELSAYNFHDESCPLLEENEEYTENPWDEDSSIQTGIFDSPTMLLDQGGVSNETLSDAKG